MQGTNRLKIGVSQNKYLISPTKAIRRDYLTHTHRHTHTHTLSNLWGICRTKTILQPPTLSPRLQLSDYGTNKSWKNDRQTETETASPKRIDLQQMKHYWDCLSAAAEQKWFLLCGPSPCQQLCLESYLIPISLRPSSWWNTEFIICPYSSSKLCLYIYIYENHYTILYYITLYDIILYNINNDTVFNCIIICYIISKCTLSHMFFFFNTIVHYIIHYIILFLTLVIISYVSNHIMCVFLWVLLSLVFVRSHHYVTVIFRNLYSIVTVKPAANPITCGFGSEDLSTIWGTTSKGSGLVSVKS